MACDIVVRDQASKADWSLIVMVRVKGVCTIGAEKLNKLAFASRVADSGEKGRVSVFFGRINGRTCVKKQHSNRDGPSLCGEMKWRPAVGICEVGREPPCE